MAEHSLARFVPSTSHRWDRAKAAHLLNRAGFGGRPEEVDHVLRLGPEAAVEELLNYDRIPEEFPPPNFSDVRALFEEVARLRAGRAPEAERRQAFQAALRANVQKLQELRAWWLARMIQTRRPLQEKMVLFWHGFLVSGYPDARIAEFLYVQNELFRRMALGNFKALVLAISRDPAMLQYLDNDSNRKGRPNENYARELLELFTMGIGHYTEQDVREAARAFTGWTHRGYLPEFVFNPAWHDDGPKTFLGRTGNLDGTDIIDVIFEQPATARRLPTRLFEYFGYLRPEEHLVEEMADLFRRSAFEVRPLVRAILTSQAFYSPRAMRTQVKSPAQLVVGTARLLEIEPARAPQLLRAMDLMGQALFAPPNVGGWPQGERWITTSTILQRYNFSALVLTGGAPGIARRQRDLPPVPAAVMRLVEGARTASEVVDRLAGALVGGLDAGRRAALVRALGASDPQVPFDVGAPDSGMRLRSALHLLMSSAEYQLA
ncbi:MAG: DUF1800 domain-containing protein [Armatimonadota bacterium]|nr:DUF1800 domain-containing protein [Armatimonadota bacterium]